jgi:hypothetical protein
VLTPNDYSSPQQLVERITAFGERYSALGKPFAWTFSRHDLERRLSDVQLIRELAPSLAQSRLTRPVVPGPFH